MAWCKLMLLVEETEEAERAKGVRWVPPFSNSPPAPRMRVCNTLPYPMPVDGRGRLGSLSFCVDLLSVVSPLYGLFAYFVCGELCARSMFKLLRPIRMGLMGNL